MDKLVDFSIYNDAESRVIEDGPYTLALVTVDDDDDGDSLANMTSTLEADGG